MQETMIFAVSAPLVGSAPDQGAGSGAPAGAGSARIEATPCLSFARRRLFGVVDQNRRMVADIWLWLANPERAAIIGSGMSVETIMRSA